VGVDVEGYLLRWLREAGEVAERNEDLVAHTTHVDDHRAVQVVVYDVAV
jgi:hypothetical protein